MIFWILRVCRLISRLARRCRLFWPLLCSHDLREALCFLLDVLIPALLPSYHHKTAKTYHKSPLPKEHPIEVAVVFYYSKDSLTRNHYSKT